MSAYKYSLDENLVANATTNPDNWCFNPKADVFQVRIKLERSDAGKYVSVYN